MTTPANAAAAAATDKWVAQYVAANGNSLVDVTLGTVTYTFDLAHDRVVCVTGQSAAPDHPRDSSRQQGHPTPAKGDHKGHAIAYSMGGRMDVNIFAQNAALNLSKEWRAIERHAANHPGTSVAMHFNYEGDSDRPAAIDYGYETVDGSFAVEHFDNPSSS